MMDPHPCKPSSSRPSGRSISPRRSSSWPKRPWRKMSQLTDLAANSISRQQIDQEEAAVEEADARVKAYEKNKRVYELNHEFTKVVSAQSAAW